MSKVAIPSRRLLRASEFPAVALSLLALVVFTFLGDDIMSVATAKNVLSQASSVMLMAVGFTLVLIAGQLDLSVGSIAALGGIVVITVQPLSLPLAVVAALVVTLAAGLINGVLVTKVGVPSLVATLATLIGFRGLAFLISGGRPIQGNHLDLAIAIERSVFRFLSTRIIIMIVIVAASAFIMRRSVWGRDLYAAGGAREAARASGINVDRRLIGAFVVSGLMSGIAGLIQALALNSASPRSGETALLLVVAAVVVGGVALTGGVGSIGGAFVGMLLITGVTVAMNRLGIESAYQRVLLGSVLIAVVLITPGQREEGDAPGLDLTALFNRNRSERRAKWEKGLPT